MGRCAIWRTYSVFRTKLWNDALRAIHSPLQGDLTAIGSNASATGGIPIQYTDSSVIKLSKHTPARHRNVSMRHQTSQLYNTGYSIVQRQIFHAESAFLLCDVNTGGLAEVKVL